MATHAIFSLVIGAFELVLVLVLAWRLGRFARSFPWLAVMLAYFSFRGALRVFGAFGAFEGERASIVTDAAVLVILVVLFAGIERTVARLRLTVDEAEFRRSEYDRALRDYRRIARHRLATPLTAIRGAAVTLKDVPLSDAQRAELLDALVAATDELEHVTLDPLDLRLEERGLEPTPRAGVS